MPGDVPETATCEICGTTFDPADSRGWCPNTDCGEWQHPAYRDGGEGETAGGGGLDAPTKTCPNCGKEVRADANFCKFCANEFEGDAGGADEGDAGPAGAESVLDECPDCGADLSRIPSDRLSDCPICGTDLSDVLAASDEPPITPADLHACPACEADLTDIPPEMRLVCPGCHTSLEDAIEEDVDAAHAHARVDVLAGIAEGYSGRLAEAGVETVGDLLRADPASLAEATDVAESRVAEWIEGAPLDPADVGAGAPSADAADATTTDEPAGTAAPGETGANAGPGVDAESSADAGAGVDDGASGPPSDAESPGAPAVGDDAEPATDADAADAASGGEADDATPEDEGASPGAPGDPVPTDEPAGANAGTGTGPEAETGAGGDAGGPEPDDGDLEMETRIQPPAPTVVLEVMGRDIHVEDGDTIGREIRTAMVEGGAPEDDAVYVHREHARLELVGGECYLTRLGENSLKVNDQRVGEHERIRVENGDEVSFSEVVTATVRIE